MRDLRLSLYIKYLMYDIIFHSPKVLHYCNKVLKQSTLSMVIQSLLATSLNRSILFSDLSCYKLKYNYTQELRMCEFTSLSC